MKYHPGHKDMDMAKTVAVDLWLPQHGSCTWTLIYSLTMTVRACFFSLMNSRASWVHRVIINTVGIVKPMIGIKTKTAIMP